jgi:hypothetical protein
LTGVAVKKTCVPAQTLVDGLATILTLATPLVFTVMFIAFEVAGDPVAQLRLLVIMQVIISLFARVVEVYVEFVAPEIAVPLFFHRYAAVPPLVAVAVKVTLVFTVMFIAFEVAGDPVAQLRLLVIKQVITSEFARAVDV